MTKAFEVNFDGLIGQTHNYAGLAYGNVASEKNQGITAYPKKAALQSLEKMKLLMDLGLKQAVLPPQERPHIAVLKKNGFSGSDSDIIAKAAKENPELFLAACSASSMWTANAATVSPSADTENQKVHFTPANLVSKLHRSIEWPTTAKVLKAIFSDSDFFHHHEALPQTNDFGDEGAANHTRLCGDYHEPGVEVFVYGKSANDTNLPKKFPARQSLEASQKIAKAHGLNPDHAVFLKQNPKIIDKGVFHNDVIAVGNQHVLFFHEEAFETQWEDVFQDVAKRFRQVSRRELTFIPVPTEKVTVDEAVKTYLFNTQLITLPNDKMVLIAPKECEESKPVKSYLDELLQYDDQSIKAVHYVDVRESMQNGGGPACLRLRVVLNEDEIAATNQSVFLTNDLYSRLQNWINTHYRDQMTLNDLQDPNLLKEVRTALDELTQILNLGSVYDFQV